MKSKIAIIVPYEELQKDTQKVLAELGIEAQILVGDLDEGVQCAKEAILQGIGAIVSRGGTALLIERSLDIPVIQIQVSPYDIFKCLASIKNCPNEVGLVGFSNVIYGCESIGNLLGINIRQLEINSPDEVAEKLQQSKETGIKLIIGDAVSVKKAQAIGLEGVLIKSGKEAIVKAVLEATNMADISYKDREKTELLETIINTVQNGIVAVDQEYRITHFNPIAERIFRQNSQEVLGKLLYSVLGCEVFKIIQRANNHEIIYTLQDKNFLVKRVNINVNSSVVGALVSFQDVTQIQKLEQTVRRKLFTKGLVAKNQLTDIVGESDALRTTLHSAAKYATIDATVLIHGETGTGKEMFAQGIHNLSNRANKAFVAINCAALPEGLLESELFGYEEGAFTGAKRGGKQGLFELAHGGTIFLDEIGEMALPLQSRLLRVLEEREVLRVGGERMIPIDVRIIAATNRHLKQRIKEGLFREDLYYRLNVLYLPLPPLRERKSDIPILAQYFLKKYRYINPMITEFSPSVMTLFEQYGWPGNIRELENIIQRLVILSETPVVQAERASGLLNKIETEDLNEQLLEGSLKEIEARIIQHVLREENLNKAKAAKRLGIDRSTLWRKLDGVAKDDDDVLK